MQVRINSINAVDRKISLELVSGGPDPWQEKGSGIENSVQTVIVEEVKPVGLSVRLENGMLGFIPRGELRNKMDADMLKKYAEGDSIKAPCSGSSSMQARPQRAYAVPGLCLRTTRPS